MTNLSLEDVGGDDLRPVAIKEGKSGAESRGRDTPQDGLSNDATPARLRLVDGCNGEVRSMATFYIYRNQYSIPLLKKSSKRRDSRLGVFS